MNTFPLLALCCCGFILHFNTNLTAQTCTYDNMYDNPADWTFVQAGENVPDITLHPGPGEINIVDNRLEFIQLRGGGNDKRVHRSIPALSDTWMVEFDGRITQGNPFYSPGAFWYTLLALTAGDEIPLTNMVFPVEVENPQFVNSVQDGIVLEVRSVGTATSVHVMLNDDGIITDACSVLLPINLVNNLPKSGQIQLENFGDGYGQLRVELPSDTLIGKCCFEIPSTLVNLTHIQHGCSPVAEYTRRITGGIDNLCITDGSTLNASCNTTVGVADRSADFSMNIFPNPVRDMLTIQVAALGSYASTWNVKVLDMQGRLFMEKAFAQSEGLNQSIDISRLAAGSYALVVQGNNGEFRGRKIFVKR